jgi:iron-sulfur cluster assembly accessory protein
MTFPIALTETAAEKAWTLLSSQGREELKLRVKVSPGGCSGLIYALYFDDQEFDGDLKENFGELEVVVDRMSAPYLEGAVVDFKDTIEKQGFDIENPNAAGSCACGDSFH